MPYSNYYKIKTNSGELHRGALLLSEPFLKDSFFLRSVVLLISHETEGSMGLVLNKPLSTQMNHIVPEFQYLEDIPLYSGGPVGTDSLFYVHRIKSIRESLDLGNGLFLNGNFDDMKEYVLQNNPTEGYVRFFRGYSGWTGEQLQEELNTNSWILSSPHKEPLQYDKEMWQKSMKSLGGKYAIWSKFPVIPSFN